MIPKMNRCRGDFDETKYMSFLTENEKFLEKYNELWNTVQKNI